MSPSNAIPELDFTGERVVPGKTPTLLVLEHLVRYRFAARFSKGSRVLDVGCGTGYGAAVLAETAGLTVGIDCNWEAIHHASKAYPQPNLRFALSDCRNLPFRDRSFKLAVFFEVIEHVREQEQCLREIRRVLSSNGILIISTPNAFRSTKVIEGENPFHHKEFNEGEFKELLLRHFDNVQLLYQHELSASGIQLPATRMSDRVDLVEDLSAAPAAKYFIAVCGARRTAISPRRTVGVAGIEAQIADVLYLRQIEKEVSALLLQREKIEREYTSNLDAHRQEIDALKRHREKIEREYTSNLDAHRREIDALKRHREQIVAAHRREIEERARQQTELEIQRAELETQNSALRIELEWLYRWIPTNRLARRLLFGKNLRRRFIAGLRSLAKPGFRNRFPRSVDQERQAQGAPKAGPLTFETPAGPQVSIIIPVYDGCTLTRQCLESVLRHTTDVNYEVLVVDDGSRDSTQQMLSRTKGLRVFRNQGNRGYIDSCNHGAEEAKGKYLLFLKSDTSVAPHWLKELLKTFESEPKAGVVGAKLVDHHGRLQEAGSILWRDGSTLRYGQGDDPLKPEYSHLREVDFCSAACLLVRKDIFQELGGFDTRFMPMGYEDADLCMGVREKGHKVLYQPKSVIYRHEHLSSPLDHSKNFIERNRLRFAEKWREELQGYYEFSPSRTLSARDRHARARILVVDDRVPAPDAGSGYPRAYALLNFLAELKYKVTLFPAEDPEPYQPCLNDLQQLGVEVMFGRADFADFSAERAATYDAVLVSRPHNFKKTYFLIKDHFSNAALIYDAEALFFKRDELKAKTRGKSLSPTEVERAAQAELNLLSLADAISCVSESEKGLICQKSGVSAAKIFVWGHPVSPQPTPRAFGERNDILFVGAFPAADSPNEDAVVYFIEEIFPEVRKELDCSFSIVGAQPPNSVQRYESPRIKVLGYVKDLSEYYDAFKVFVVPHRYSAGIPWKLSEAMSRGIPAVVSPLTANQLALTDGKEVLVGSTPREFASKVIRLYRDALLWNKIRENALAFIRETHKPAVLKECLDDIIQSALRNREAFLAEGFRTQSRSELTANTSPKRGENPGLAS